MSGIFFGGMPGRILGAWRLGQVTLVVSPAILEEYRRVALETHLRHEPAKISKSRIKRLRGLSRPQYRLRVDNFRVFYDIEDQEVQILAIIAKDQAAIWLKAHGTEAPGSGTGKSEG